MRLIMPQLTRPPARTHPSAPENETFIRITNLVYFTVEPINSSVCVDVGIFLLFVRCEQFSLAEIVAIPFFVGISCSFHYLVAIMLID